MNPISASNLSLCFAELGAIWLPASSQINQPGVPTMATLETGTERQSLSRPKFCPTIVEVRGTRIWIALWQTHDSIYDIYVHVHIMCRISVCITPLAQSILSFSPSPPSKNMWIYEIQSLVFSLATRKWSQFGNSFPAGCVLRHCYIMKRWIWFDLVRTGAAVWKGKVYFLWLYRPCGYGMVQVPQRQLLSQRDTEAYRQSALMILYEGRSMHQVLPFPPGRFLNPESDMWLHSSPPVVGGFE